MLLTSGEQVFWSQQHVFESGECLGVVGLVVGEGVQQGHFDVLVAADEHVGRPDVPHCLAPLLGVHLHRHQRIQQVEQLLLLEEQTLRLPPLDLLGQVVGVVGVVDLTHTTCTSA